MAALPQNIRNLIGGLNGGGLDGDVNLADTAETVKISSLALMKMLRHGRAGVPMEVMGLILGEFVDEYTIKVVDVFSMPQSGNTVSVEAVDPVYQAEMLEMLKKTGRPEMVVGWYHSHPGFGCWFSGTDINTQQSFEQLNSRAVGIVVDPIQSVKGVVVIDCFRLINPHLLMMARDPRQTTSNIGHLKKPSIAALIHGLNKHYHSLVIGYHKSDLEQNILLGLMRSKWTDALKIESYDDFDKKLEDGVHDITELLKKYKTEVEEDMTLSEQEFLLKRVGRLHAQKQLENTVDNLLNSTIGQNVKACVSSIVF